MKKLIAVCTVVGMVLSLSACGGSTSNESAGTTNQPTSSAEVAEPTPEPTPEPAPDLTGVWTQVDAGDSYQQATIQGDTIEINWINSDGTTALYWAGSYTAPETAAEPYSWTSENDTAKTSGALLASQDASKEFTYENGTISYEASMMGVTTTLQLEKTGEVDESSTSDTTNTTGTTFSDGVYTSDEYTITITDYKVIQPGDTGNEYGDKPVIAFWYDTTNVASDTALNPSTAWMLVFEAVQDNDPNAVNTLNVGMLPDDQFLDSQLQDIKIGGTVSNAVAYELDDLTTPVTLTAQDMFGTVYGSQDFTVAQ